jgi:predicted nucleic acid-binding protein
VTGRAVLLDTGPLVAYLDRRDSHHAWAFDRFSEVTAPMLTCESVISEACFLTRHLPRGNQSVLALLQRGAVKVQFSLQEQLHAVANLVDRYRNVPMSLADACLVRMSEVISDCMVFTLDTDFRVYRRHRRKAIPLLMPAGPN